MLDGFPFRDNRADLFAATTLVLRFKYRGGARFIYVPRVHPLLKRFLPFFSTERLEKV